MLKHAKKELGIFICCYLQFFYKSKNTFYSLSDAMDGSRKSLTAWSASESFPSRVPALLPAVMHVYVLGGQEHNHDDWPDVILAMHFITKRCVKNTLSWKTLRTKQNTVWQGCRMQEFSLQPNFLAIFIVSLGNTKLIIFLFNPRCKEKIKLESVLLCEADVTVWF